VEFLSAPCEIAMAHNDKTNAAPFVILPFVLLSLCLGFVCAVSMRQRGESKSDACHVVPTDQ
jgi:hypothetical protein